MQTAVLVTGRFSGFHVGHAKLISQAYNKYVATNKVDLLVIGIIVSPSSQKVYDTFIDIKNELEVLKDITDKKDPLLKRKKELIKQLEVLQKNNLLLECQRKGEYFRKKLEELKLKFPDVIKEVRVIGLMAGLELVQEGMTIVQKMLDKGILINCTAEKVLRFLPPLIVQESEINLLIQALEEVLSEIK